MSMYSRSSKDYVRAKLAERDGNICNMCGRFFTDKLPSTIDHINPKRKKGTNSSANLQLLCGHCNNDIKRGNSPIGIFYAQKGKQIMASAPEGTDMRILWEATRWRFRI